jgi:HEPN domain-containing protein
MQQTTLNWLHGSDYDLQTAESLFKARRYIYVIFMCHLAVEKLLKAIVAEASTAHPPRTHNLYRLLELSQIELPSIYEEIVAKLNGMSIATRYPEDVMALSAQVTRKVAQDYLSKTRELLRWLKQDTRLHPSSTATSPPSKRGESSSSA